MLIGLGAKSSGESTKALATKVIRQLRIPWLKYHWGKGILITYGQILQKNAASKSLHLTMLQCQNSVSKLFWLKVPCASTLAVDQLQRNIRA